MDTAPDDDRSCSFCGRPRAQLERLVAGPNANICDDCVLIARRILWAQVSPSYLVRLCHPGLPQSWVNYLVLLLIVPLVGILWTLIPWIAQLEPSLRGAAALVVTFASVLLCSYFLAVSFLIVSKNLLVSRLLAATSWGLTGASLAVGYIPAWLGAIGAVVASQVVVSLRPRPTRA